MLGRRSFENISLKTQVSTTTPGELLITSSGGRGECQSLNIELAGRETNQYFRKKHKPVFLLCSLIVFLWGGWLLRIVSNFFSHGKSILEGESVWNNSDPCLGDTPSDIRAAPSKLWWFTHSSTNSCVDVDQIYARSHNWWTKCDYLIDEACKFSRPVQTFRNKKSKLGQSQNQTERPAEQTDMLAFYLRMSKRLRKSFLNSVATVFWKSPVSDEASKSEEEREAERKEKAKQRRSRTNFSLEQVSIRSAYQLHFGRL